MTSAKKIAPFKLIGATVAVIGVAVAGYFAWPQAEPSTEGAAPMVRRLTPAQYQSVIADVFGADLKIGGRFEPDRRQDGLLAVGTSRVSVAVSGLTQYDAMARTIAEQAVDKKHRATLGLCTPKSETAPDDECAKAFLTRAGRLLFRRPLTAEEVALHVGAASTAAGTLKDFYAGLSLSLAAMLASPDFLFRKEVAEPDPNHAGQVRLDAWSKASRLSFFLWNSAPDDALLTAAEKGELHTAAGLKAQVDRMMASPRFETGVRAFFTDMLQFDRFASLQKDPAIYPNFTPNASEEAQEQTLRTIVDHLLTRNGDYRDLFTTRRTFLTPLLGSVYNLPVVKVTANGAPNQWTPYEFAEGDPRGIGLLGHASFISLFSHPGRSSPTVRGKAVRELLLCQRVPDPPGNVSFKVVQDTSNPDYKTARERLSAHATDATCAGCHKITDPIGLALEVFDSAAGYRTAENGVAIDGSGELNGVAYKDAVGLAKAIHDDPATVNCLVGKAYAYAIGRPANSGESPWIEYLHNRFARDGHRLSSLIRTIALSDAFYHVVPPSLDEPGPAPQREARN